MFRAFWLPASCAWLLLVLPARADHFDYYTEPVLAKALEDAGNLKELKELSSDQMAEYADVLGDTSAVFLLVVTNENRHAKLLVRPGKQRFGTEQVAPVILVERYVTYKEATERTVKAKGDNVQLYADSRLQLDLGQVVPEKLGGDLVATDAKNGGSLVLKPVNKAKLFVVTKAIPGVVPKKAPKLVLGTKFEPRFFVGSYKLYDDGRRSGQLKLEVNESGEVSGSFYSDLDGAKYEVSGQIGTVVKHSVTFKVKFPATEQTFTGFLFTGNGKAIAGTSKLQEREAGFYAERIEE